MEYNMPKLNRVLVETTVTVLCLSGYIGSIGVLRRSVKWATK